MKTIANVIIKSKCQIRTSVAVITTLVCKEESSVSVWTSSAEVANTGLPKLLLVGLKSLRHWLAELHVIQVIACNTSVCSFLYLHLMHMHAATIRLYLQMDVQ